MDTLRYNFPWSTEQSLDIQLTMHVRKHLLESLYRQSEKQIESGHGWYHYHCIGCHQPHAIQLAHLHKTESLFCHQCDPMTYKDSIASEIRLLMSELRDKMQENILGRDWKNDKNN